MFNLQQAIAEWRRQMIACGFSSADALDELESHLRDEIAAQVRSGTEEKRAFELACRHLGEPELLGKEFGKSDQPAMSTRWSFLRYWCRREIPVPPSAAFTPEVRRALEIAREEALSLGHDFVGTEHVLLGVLRTAGGALAQELQRSRVSSEAIRSEVRRLISPLPQRHQPTELPLTPRARKALLLASRKADALRHSTIGTEDIFFGLLLEGSGLAAVALSNLGLRLDRWQIRGWQR